MIARLAIVVLIAAGLTLAACEEFTPAPPLELAPPADPTPRACPFARAASPDGFDIEIEWRDTYKRWLVAEVECAAAYWEAAIIGDLPDVTGDGRFFDEAVMIDDLRVAISFVEDTPDLWGAPAEVMATTSTVIERDRRGLPYYGNIQFRLRESRYRGDLAFLYNLARHEISHALGFGEVSRFHALVQQGVFVGPTARRLAGGAPLYVDAGGHWRPTGAVLRDVMGESISGSQVVTAVTLGAFADMGYEVDYGMAGR